MFINVPTQISDRWKHCSSSPHPSVRHPPHHAHPSSLMEYFLSWPSFGPNVSVFAPSFDSYTFLIGSSKVRKYDGDGPGKLVPCVRGPNLSSDWDKYLWADGWDNKKQHLCTKQGTSCCICIWGQKGQRMSWVVIHSLVHENFSHENTEAQGHSDTVSLLWCPGDMRWGSGASTRSSKIFAALKGQQMSPWALQCSLHRGVSFLSSAAAEEALPPPPPHGGAWTRDNPRDEG